MAGIVDFLKKDSTKGAIGGVLGMALAGFNPALGLLAGPAIAGAKRESEGRLRAQELENEMKERQLTAPGRYVESTIPDGARANPFGDGFGGSMELSAPDPGAMTPEQEQTYMNALQMSPLLDIAPGIVSGKLAEANTPVRKPADQAMMEFLGLEGEEGLATLYNIKNQFGPEDELSFQKLQLELLAMQREWEETRKQDRSTKLGEVRAAEGTIKTMLAFGEANRNLKGTPLAAGNSGRGTVMMLMNMAQFFGEQFDIPQWTQFGEYLTQAGIMDKEGQNLALAAMAATAADGASVSNRAIQQMIAGGVPNADLPTGTNEILMRAMLKDHLRRIDDEGIGISANARAQAKLFLDTPGNFNFNTQDQANLAIESGMVPVGSLLIVAGQEPMIYTDED